MAHCKKTVLCRGNCMCDCKICAPERVPKTKRLQIGREAEVRAIANLEKELARRLIQKGRGTFSSTHEAFGIIAEEYDEILKALRENNIEKFIKECDDMAVACTFARACADDGGMEW